MLGLDENDGFRPVRLTDAAKLRDDLAALASDCLHPPLRIAVDVVQLEGLPIVVAEVDPVPSDHRPSYVESKGIATGSYVRVGDGDRRMTQAEIGLAIANRGQPRYDLEPVPESAIGDLDRIAFSRTIERVRQTSRAFRDMDEVTALERLRVLVRADDEALVPSLGGLLVFGTCASAPTSTTAVVESSSTTRWRLSGKQWSTPCCTVTTAAGLAARRFRSNCTPIDCSYAAREGCSGRSYSRISALRVSVRHAIPSSPRCSPTPICRQVIGSSPRTGLPAYPR